MNRTLPAVGVTAVMLLAGACSAVTAQDSQTPSTVTPPTSQIESPPAPRPAAPAPTTTTTLAAVTTTNAATTTTATTPPAPFARPAWLGTRVLPQTPDGFGEVLPTPPELMDRRFAPPQLLPPPRSGAFESRLSEVPPEVVARSSWHEGCPVTLDELSYITVSHFGFDGRAHTGEMIVNATAAADVIGVFAELFALQFPIEEMRVIRADEIDAPPTGDGNVTTSFVCRQATGTRNWSRHALGLAIDINPFHNPYLKGELVIPELASYYLQRDRNLPGMVESSGVVEAFAAIGWKWGGHWSSLKDWMHFSDSGT